MCARLHVFNVAFTHDQFQHLLERQPGSITETDLQQSYLGFVVIKPLPRTIIGRTCLRTYPPHDDDASAGCRYFPATREYRANLFGIPLKIQTVAFQEQDRVVAACATSALWSVFQCTARLFDHYIPSPVEITKAASRGAILDTRALPNAGLTTAQMAEAIRSLPLELYFVSAIDPHVFRSTVYAYLRARIPVLLVIELRGIRRGQSEEKLPHHAVAITGFNLRKTELVCNPKWPMRLLSNCVDKVYVHDDQVGPFARMEIDQEEIDGYPGRTNPEWPASLATSWGRVWTQFDKVNAAPLNMLVPLYHKIRIPFGFIHDALLPLDGLLETIRSQGHIRLSGRVIWDIHLTTVNQLKCEVRATVNLSPDRRRDLLTQHLPRFIWRAKAMDGENGLLDLLFDATDVEQGPLFLGLVVYDEAFADTMKVLAVSPEIRQQFKGLTIDQVFDRFSAKQDSG